MSDPAKEVIIDYTNYKGYRMKRRILPIAIAFENNEWHPETQWLLEAVDLDRNVTRTFALTQIHSWKVLV